MTDEILTPGAVLGLDLGSNSVGWALLKAEFNEKGEQVRETGLIACGVRVFEEGVDNFDTLKEKSRSQARRDARSARRLHQRRSHRKARLRKILHEAGLFPSDPNAMLECFELDPYALRAKALDEELKAVELGRVLYHINQRRGFKSNRKDARKSSEAGVVKEAIGKLREEMKATGSRTLGEHLNKLRVTGLEGKKPLLRGELRLRNRYTERAMYEEEFEAIWQAQSRFAAHSRALTPGLKKKLHDDIIFAQRHYEVTEERLSKVSKRANAWRSPAVGKCPLTQEKRLQRGHWLAQQFRILKEVNNLEIWSTFGGRRPLTNDERARVVHELSESRERKFEDLAKSLNKLHLELGDDIRAPGIGEREEFNLSRGSRAKLNGNSVEKALVDAFGKRIWAVVEDAEKMRLRLAFSELAINEDDPEQFTTAIRALFAPHHLKEGALKKLSEFGVADGYMSYSRAAIEKLLPYLRGGDNEYDAIDKANLRPGEKAAIDKLPLPTELPNPVVMRALFELRKVVNAVIREYGKPTRIMVEMAREMHGGKEARSERSAQMREREENNKRIAAEVEKLGKPPTGANIEKYKLWEEQGGFCPYTGDKIGQAAIFSGEVQIDHIFPRWQSLDDSLNNKVLAFADANREKGDQTPFQWLGGKKERNERMLNTVERSKMPRGKKLRFSQAEFDASGFAKRQLNDTSYLAREAVAFLNRLYPPEIRVGEKAVGSSRGGLTAELRRQWGLNSILSEVRDGKGEVLKTRQDHRHHAVDAIVIALSSRAHLKAYQDYWKKREYIDRRANENAGKPEFAPPWEHFRDNAAAAVDAINVSHRVQRKIRGAFHEATYFGPTAEKGRYVFRVNLDESLTGGDVAAIRDSAIRQLVESRLKEKGWNGEDNKLPKAAFEQPLKMPSGVAIKRVRVIRAMKGGLPFHRPEEPNPFRFAELGNNHHMEIVDAGDGTLRAAVVPMIEAARRVRREGVPAIRKDHGSGLALLMSLARKESVLARDPASGKDVLCIVQMMSGKPELASGIDLYLRDARDARPASEGNKSPFKRFKSFEQWPQFNIRKVRVSPLGTVELVSD